MVKKKAIGLPCLFFCREESSHVFPAEGSRWFLRMIVIVVNDCAYDF
jgi:hypothetical protein